MLIDPKGRVLRCTVTEFIGDKILAGSICGLLGKLKIPPAKVEGKPAYGRTKTVITFFLPETSLGQQVRKYGLEPDLRILVDNPPEKERDREVVLTVLVGLSGKIERCEKRKKDLESLAQIACARLGSQLEKPPSDGASGFPYVTSYRVEFFEEATPHRTQSNPISS